MLCVLPARDSKVSGIIVLFTGLAFPRRPHCSGIEFESGSSLNNLEPNVGAPHGSLRYYNDAYRYNFYVCHQLFFFLSLVSDYTSF